MAEQGNNDLSQRRKLLLLSVTDKDFRHWADVFWIKFTEILHEEIKMAQTRPELWVLPATAVADFPGFDETTMAEVHKEWVEVRRKYQNPNRDLGIFAYSTENPLNHLMFDSTYPKLRLGSYACQMILIDGVNLPLSIHNKSGLPRLVPKPETPDETFTNLILALTKAFDPEAVADLEKYAHTRKTIERAQFMNKTSENLALNLLLKQPEEFSRFFNPQIMRVIPNRLMTDLELNQWQQMVQEIMNQNKSSAIRVGLPGYHGYKRYEGIFQFGLGLALKSTYLDEKGKDRNQFVLSVPVAIRNGNTRLGWMIASPHYFPTLGQINVQFHHGADQIFWFDLLKKQR